MKKTILSIVILILSVSLSAQSVIMDNLDKAGYRHIAVSGVDALVEHNKYTFYLEGCNGLNDMNGIKTWFLHIESLAYIPDNAILLIKLKSGDIIEGTFEQTDTYNSISPAYIPILGTSSGLLLDQNVQMHRATFRLTDNDVRKITEDGLAKLRVSSKNSYIECKGRNARHLREFFSAAKRKINKRLTKEYTGKKSIRNDF